MRWQIDWLTKMQQAYHSLFINTKTSIIESNKIRTLPNGTVYKDEQLKTSNDEQT